MWHTWQTKVKGKNKINVRKIRNQVFSSKQKGKRKITILPDEEKTLRPKKLQVWNTAIQAIETRTEYIEINIQMVVQAKKSIWRMPWHWEPKKDVISCEKLRWAANKLRPADIRMWEHLWWRIIDHILNEIGIWGEPPELKHLSRGRKRNQTRFR